jgi:hypothetical protein
MWSPQNLQDEARRAIAEAITWHTVSLSPPRSVPTKKFTHGSGVCIEYMGRPFIVTAQHVLDEIEELGFPPGDVRVGTRSPKPLEINLSGKIPKRVRGISVNETVVLPIDSVSESTDLDDLALLHLPGAPGDYNPIRFHVVDANRISPSIGAEVLVVGHPSQELFTPDIGKEETRWMTGTYALEAYVVDYKERGLEIFDSSAHYLVDFETGGESKEYLQSARGMSGAGVWLLPPSVPRTQIWDGTRVRLVGIQVSWYESVKLLKVTRIERLLELLKAGTAEAGKK